MKLPLILSLLGATSLSLAIPVHERFLSGDPTFKLRNPEGTFVSFRMKDDSARAIFILNLDGTGVFIEEATYEFDYRIFLGEAGWIIVIDKLRSETGPDGDPRPGYPKKIRRLTLSIDRTGQKLVDPNGHSYFKSH